MSALFTASCTIPIPITALRTDDSAITIRTGSRSGKVIDAVTGKPIEGAVVMYRWFTKEFVVEQTIMYGTNYEILTDKKGKYSIPSQTIKSEGVIWAELGPEDVVVYKYGYVAYKVVSNKVRLADDLDLPELRQKYRKWNNVVKLRPWPEDFSHLEHTRNLKYWNCPMLKEAVEEEEILAEKERQGNRHQRRRNSGLLNFD